MITYLYEIESLQNKNITPILYPAFKNKRGNYLFFTNFTLFILGERGFVISLNGLNDKLSLLLKTILGHFQKFDENIDVDFFEAVRDQVKKNYYNTFIKPDRVVKELRLFMMQDVYR